MTSIKDQSSLPSRHDDQPDFNLKEWSLKARISHENTNSRRFSASYLKSFREDNARSFRSNITISSVTSSPGYITFRDEIDPSTYSFTTALKALQAKTVYRWEYMSPDGLTLNSKWSDAEKYICNPISGEVPLECLSAKTLSRRSFLSQTNRITMSAPLIYSSPMEHLHHAKKSMDEAKFSAHDIKETKGVTPSRNVGTQSTPVDLSWSSPSPVATPSIEDISTKHYYIAQGGDSPVSSGKCTSEKEVAVKETGDEEYTEGDEGVEKEGKKERKLQKLCRCQVGGCISFRTLWMKTRHRDNKYRP